MLDTLLTTLLIVAIAVLLLSVKILFVKGGKFPNTHVGGSQALRKKGVGCVQAQDAEAHGKVLMTPERMEEVLDNKYKEQR